MKILHENSHGIKIIREDMKKRSKVTVRNSYGDCLRIYRFNNVQEELESPFISWKNLDCCGGWSFDESYLDTAVQRGLKLYAGRTQALKQQYLPHYPTMEEAMVAFESFASTLPKDIVTGQETLRESNSLCLSTFVCRTGTISDYIDLDTVFDFYKKLGITVPEEEVRGLCNIEIAQFGSASAPYIYFNANTASEFITTGLLLGYPLESTASILSGY